MDFEADDEVVLPDPYGLVKSRALRSRCSSIRLPLNISENRNTAISHALSSYRGSGVHHIAFDCDDIFAEVSRAKEAGVPLLDIPLNYYDDLAARFDFDDEFLSELAYFNVLYDRDAQGGELFHVYTEPFEGRFFFEIIQRKKTATRVTARPTWQCDWRPWLNREVVAYVRQSCRKNRKHGYKNRCLAASFTARSGP